MRTVVVAVAAALTALVSAGAAHADVTITPVCNGSPCSTGWYTANVTVSFTVQNFTGTLGNCGPYQVSSDTSDYAASCSVQVDASTTVTKTVHVKRDATPPTATAITAARAPDANGWYNHAVDVSVSGSDATSGIASCTTTTYSGPDSSSASVSGTCRDGAGNVSAPQTLSLKYDATPPSIDAAAARAPDANDWYNHPVGVAFTGSDATSGIGSCTSGAYSGPDNVGATVSGTCQDNAGNVATRAFGLQYDATPPTVTGGTPDRPPDAGDWYNHRVVITFAGTDGASGIASCDAVPYEKPDSTAATVSGSCVDKAGNTSAPGSFKLAYDSTPPSLSSLSAAVGAGGVTLAWKASHDVASLRVTRAAGAGGPTPLYSGKPIASLVDRDVRNGVQYAYTVTAHDAAGNAVTRNVVAVPLPPLIAPRREAHLRGAPTLRWRPVENATYYNVQIRLRGQKILTTWPASTSLHVAAPLRPGRYVWAVWPGFGPRTKHRYGALIGTSAFVVTR